MPRRFGRHVGVATGILGAAGGVGGFFLPTLLRSLKQISGSYVSGLMALCGLAVMALVILSVALSGWTGVWIARHDRAVPHAGLSTPENAKTE